MKKATIDKSRCVACGECAYKCPRGAIRILNGCYANVNVEECVGCGFCARHCPAACIVVEELKENS